MATKTPRQTGDAGSVSRDKLYSRIAKTPGASRAMRELRDFDDPLADAYADAEYEKGT